MILAGAPAPTFAAIRCADLDDQDRRLAALNGGVSFLALAPVRPKSLVRPFEPWIFTLADGDRAVAVAAGYLRDARVGRSLVLVLSTPIADTATFWTGVRSFMRERRASRLVVESVGEGHPPIPRLEGEVERLEATNYVIDLREHAGRASLATNHRRNVQRAARAGVEVRRRTDGEAAAMHAALVRASMERIAARGDDLEGAPAEAALRTYLSSGRAAIFQARVGGQVCSSDLIVRIGDAAYYLSGGTSPEGNKLGTAHHLMLAIIEQLKGEGACALNLGYPSAPGLARFKEGFGARAVPVERVQAQVTGRVVAALRALSDRLRALR